MDKPAAYAFYATLMLVAYAFAIAGVFGAWR